MINLIAVLIQFDVNVGTSSIDFDPRTEICVSKCGADRYVLVDSSKFHVRPYIDKVMKLEDIHHIITNKDVSEENIKALKDAHIDVLLALNFYPLIFSKKKR